MGCCVSSLTTDQKDDPISGKNTAPPPSVNEEETVVKEVLSETTLVTDDTTSNKIPEDKEKKPGAVKLDPGPGLTENGLVEPEKGSKVSEICSLSESLLCIVNECNEEEAKQRKLHGVRQRSPAKSRNRVMVHNYPTRRTDMSPRKRNTEGGEGEEAGSVRLVTSGTGQRDPNERSGRRRSRSPAMKRSVVMGPTRDHYSISTDNGGANLSPGRVRPDPNKNGSDHQRWPSCGAAGRNDVSTSTESFENPLVMLECFIFV
ncbi:Uncharacterized protein Rs2_22396 [Raphanus sativus]|uniref:Uncharacterized protein LOC108833373 n=1 Tax=Raphanus sativus TaxID=3726 RepID=A0A6J0LR81_RAPSA|nr:uncharacterized protein LOC108833373 [Raphanus sativus]KAJ4895602.1 Uncharacterized protein Rs2_22396 [Raphanus sativus]